MLELTVVIPVYNEEGCIKDVVISWHDTLEKLAIDFNILILNDGSTDKTISELDYFKNWPRIEIISKKNSGHGPTILQGYHQAVDQARWVFQCDGDNEIKPDAFVQFWQQRDHFDALMGIRHGRKQNLVRKTISSCSRGIVFMFSGKGVLDVNVPYRLLRCQTLKKIIQHIPPDTFAPNIIISIALSKSKARIWQCPVVHQSRKTGKVSLNSLKAFRMAFKALVQTAKCLK